MIRLLLVLLMTPLCISCDRIAAIFDNGTDIPSNENIVKQYYDNGKLKSFYTTNELRQKHGIAQTFRKDGALKQTFEYENGEKVKATSHYENGNPLMEIHYKNEMKDGPLRRFYESGQMESEIIYKENYPGTGLKEYMKSGKLKTQYPNLIVKAINRLNKNGKYIIEVYFDKNPSRGTYYLGELNEGKYLNYKLDKLERSNYHGRLELKPPPGVIIMEKLSFVGEYKTPTGNKYIVQKDFNVAIDNPF